jgi:hypothetical protein
MLPNQTILNVLQPAFEPCPGFNDTCSEMKWNPAQGHVPRGFAGALGSIKEVSLVLVTAEPGDPYETEVYPSAPSDKVLEASCIAALNILERAKDLYHRNLHYLLDGCFPGLDIHEQLRRTWITDTVLCSAPKEGGKVSKSVSDECRLRYLENQLRCFHDPFVIALGKKAEHRLKGWPGVVAAFSVAPPGCNRKEARPSWDRPIRLFHAR